MRIKDKTPSICIIVLNWNGKKLLEDCLGSLLKLTNYPNYKVIVVDNGSTDGSVEFVEKKFPKIVVLALDKNYGFSKGNNEGMRYAFEKYNPEYILLLNNDTEIIQKEWLMNLIDVALKNEKIGIVSCKLMLPDGIVQDTYGKLYPEYGKFPHISIIQKFGRFEEDNGQYDKVKKVMAVSGSCLLISRKLVKKVGVYDEVYSPFGGEDQDFFFRTINNGFYIFYCGLSEIVHKGRVSIEKFASDERVFNGIKNNLILAFRYYPLSYKIREIAKSFFQSLFNKNFLIRIPMFIKALIMASVMYKHRLDKL